MNAIRQPIMNKMWLVPFLFVVLSASSALAQDTLYINISGDEVLPGHQLALPVVYVDDLDTIGFIKMRFTLESNLTYFWSDSTIIDTCYNCLDSLCSNLDTTLCTLGTGLIDVAGTALADWPYVRARKESDIQISVTASYAMAGQSSGTPISRWTNGTLITVKPIAGRDCNFLDTLPLDDRITYLFQPANGVGEYYLNLSYAPLTAVKRQFGYAVVQPPITAQMHGDVNYDRVVDVLDVSGLINYAFRGGDEPCPICAGDINCDSVIDVIDVNLLINYAFRGGDPPCATEDCTYYP